MLAKLWKRLLSPSPARVRELQHPRLGSLKLNEDGGWWTAEVEAGRRNVKFSVGGGGEPDPALLEHAVEILDDFGSLEDSVRRLLEEQAKALPHLADEIAKLEIEELALWWPERPDDGMIFFAGPDEHRLWRCDYIHRKPQSLGFDS